MIAVAPKRRLAAKLTPERALLSRMQTVECLALTNGHLVGA